MKKEGVLEKFKLCVKKLFFISLSPWLMCMSAAGQSEQKQGLFNVKSEQFYNKISDGIHL